MFGGGDFFSNVASGAVAGGMSLIFTHPFAVVRNRLGMDLGTTTREYNGPKHLA